MSIKKAKKFGLFVAIMMLVGTVVGVGVFIKNYPVMRANGYNGTGTLVSWIVGGVIALLAAFSFAEIGSSSKTHGGLGEWAEKFVGKKFGRSIKVLMPTFYFTLVFVAISVFAGESIMTIVGKQGIALHIGVDIVIGLTISLFFLFMKWKSSRSSGVVQTTTVIIKFIPLIIVIFVGLIGPNGSHSGNLFTNSSDSIKSFKFTSMLSAIPAVLFAFDSFLLVGNLAKDVKKPKRNVPLAIIIGMGSVLGLYLLIAIAQILVGQGTASNVFGIPSGGIQGHLPAVSDNDPSVPHGLMTAAFPTAGDANGWLTKVFNTLIFISIVGVINGISTAQIRSMDQAIKDDLIIGSKSLMNVEKKFGDLAGGLVGTIIALVSATVVLSIPACVMNSDIVFDAESNFPTLFFFGVYAITIAGGIRNRITNKVEVKKVRGFMILAPIAVVGITFIAGYQLFYHFFAEAIINPNTQGHFGLWVNHYRTNGINDLYLYEGAIIFASFLLLFVAIPSLNLFFKHKFEAKEGFKTAFLNAIKLVPTKARF